MKAVIPVAGAGTQLRPHTHTQPKPLIPVAGKPILGHIIDSLCDAGLYHQIFIIGYLGDKIQEYVLSNYGQKITAEFVVQEPRRGLADAIWHCKKLLEGTPEILVVLGDTFFGEDIKKILECEGSRLGVQEVADPRKFGVAQLDENQEYITRMIEKPQIPKSNLASVGLYKVHNVPLLMEIVTEMKKEKPNSNSEVFLLTEAITKMIGLGEKFKPYKVESWYDCGSRDTLLLTNRIMLEREISPQYEFNNTVIIPPVHIAANCNIQNSVIGPYVAIAEHTTIENSIVKNSLIGAYSNLQSIILNDSVLGNDTSLKGKAHRVNIGDSTEIDFDE